jgi:phenylpropionate dioxygenase-like ring-hydroxylating dioxygenase large terminal subunit
MDFEPRLDELVDWRRGHIAPAIYFDEHIYRQELERIFSRTWLPVAHEDMVRKPGDYLTTYMGDVAVIVVRGDDARVRVLVNRCAHRGNQVCLFDRGNARAFTCSYHGWSYGLGGELLGMPRERELYRDELDKRSWGLEEVRSANFHGLIFGTFDASAEPLATWLGDDVRWWLENFVLAIPMGGLEMLPGFHRYVSPGNWKLASENFIGDNYHVFHATHSSWMRTRRSLAEAGLTSPTITFPSRGTGRHYEGTCGYGRGCVLGMGAVHIDDSSMYERDLKEAEGLGPDAAAYVRERYAALQRALRDVDAKPYSFVNGALFPNLGLMGYISPLVARMFLHFFPSGPLKHEVWQWTMVEKAAPQAVREVALARAYQGQHMAGVIAPDDVENFERIVHATGPARNWKRPFNYEMQINHEHEDLGNLPGHFGPEPSEVNQRQFYRCWLELMGAGERALTR